MRSEKIKRKLREWYNKIAVRYDTWGQRPDEFDIGSFPEEFQNFKKLIKIKRGDKILDVATGTGIYLLEMVRRGAIGYGIDVSNNMLDILKKKIKSQNIRGVVELKIAHADKIPYPDSFFDWVTCIGMFEYYPMSYVKKVLKEMKRVIKSNGKAIVDFLDIENPKVHVFKEKECSVGNKTYLYDLNFIKKIIESVGFKINRIEKVGIEVQFLLSPKKTID